MNLLARLRDMLAEVEADGDEGNEIVDQVDEVEGDEIADAVDEVDEAEGDEIADEVDGDEIADEVEGDEVEGTPGDEGDNAEAADLRATILEQAALIETLRNKIAELGGDPDEADEADEEITDTDENDIVEAFDRDYDERKARLAEITERN